MLLNEEQERKDTKSDSKEGKMPSSEVREEKGTPSSSSQNTSDPSTFVKVDNQKFLIGDVVKAKLGFMMFEGVIVGYKEEFGVYEVDFGDDIEDVPEGDCTLVLNGLDYEIGDKVTCCPNGSSLWFTGTIIEIDRNGTFTVQMDGDDEDDIERGIPPDNLRKIRTGRNLVMTRWQRAIGKVVTVQRFNTK